MKPVYLPMPVSFEEKREWNKKGFKVVDELFKPLDAVDQPEDGEDSNSKQKPKKPPL